MTARVASLPVMGRPESADQGEATPEKLLHRVLIGPGVLVSNPRGHAPARLFEEFGPGEDLLLQGHPPGPQHTIPVEGVDQLFGGFHEIPTLDAGPVLTRDESDAPSIYPIGGAGVIGSAHPQPQAGLGNS